MLNIPGLSKALALPPTNIALSSVSPEMDLLLGEEKLLGPVSASCIQPVGVPTLKADIVTL